MTGYWRPPVPQRSDPQRPDGQRLSAAGVPDRPWARTVGAPKVEASFGYSDELGGRR